MNLFLEDRVAVLFRRRSRQAWRVFTPGQRRILALTAAAGGAVVFLAVFLRVMPVPALLEGWGQRRAERAALEEFIARAKREPVDYEAARADPKAFHGRPVVWCVDHPASGYSYLSGKPSQPLSWTNAARVPLNSPVQGGRCDLVVASVEGASRDGLLLNFVGRP